MTINKVLLTDREAWLDYETGKVGIHLLIEWESQQHEILHENGICLFDERRTLFWDSFGMALLYTVFDPDARKQDGMGKFIYWRRVKRLIENAKVYFTLVPEDEAVIECMYNINTEGSEKALEYLFKRLIQTKCISRINRLVQKYDYAIMVSLLEHYKLLDIESKVKLLKKASTLSQSPGCPVTKEELEQLTPRQRLTLLKNYRVHFNGSEEEVKQLLFPLATHKSEAVHDDIEAVLDRFAE